MSKQTSETLRPNGTTTMSTTKNALANPGKALRFVADRFPTSRGQFDELVLAASYRLAAPDYISYYKQLQNTKVEMGAAYPRNGVGHAQFQFLKRHGLDPADRMLDIGCGDLRGGQFAIEYLEAGNYTGMDISAAAIGQAVTRADREFPDKRPRLFVNDDLRFEELGSDSIDVALAQSVFTHLPPDLVQECLEHIPRVLADGGRFYATYHEAEEYHAVPGLRMGSDSMRYPFSDLKAMAEEAGLVAEQIPYPEHPSAGEMSMAVFRPE